MNFFIHRWSRLTPRRRLFWLALATCLVVALATILLLRKGGVREVLYKAF